MNERIKELAEQADNYAKQTVHYYQGQFDGLTWEGKIKQVRDTKFAELIVQEFAELIVQECADICIEMATKCAGLPADGALAKDCADWIKKNFGVDE